MITTAIILAAGMGTRLRDRAPSKPLCEVAGTPLIDHALERLAAAGLARAIVVTGYEAERIEAHLDRPQPLTVETVRTRDWHEPNGVSALAAAPLVNACPERSRGSPALLLMCDHLVEPALYRRMAESAPGTGLTLGIDRRLGHAWVDPLDVTCVRTEADRIVAIGKEQEPHDCYDTGVFAVGSDFFAALERLPSPSISNAVTALAADGQARVVDCSDLSWLDVDDAKALTWAEAWLGGILARNGN